MEAWLWGCCFRKCSSKPCSSSRCRRDFIFLSGILGCGRGRGSGQGRAGGCAVPSLCALSCSPSWDRDHPAVRHPSRDPSMMPLLPSSPHFIPWGGPWAHPSSMPTTQTTPALTWRGGIGPGPPSRGAGAASSWLFASRRTGASGEASNVPAARAELPIYSAGFVWPAAPIRKANGRVGVIAMSAEDTGGMSS